MTPTQRSLALLRQEGFLAAVVERYLHQIQRKQDLFGFADLFAFHRDGRVLLVQTTTAAHLSDRLAKVRDSFEASAWVLAGHALELHGWDGPRLRRLEVRGEDLQPIVLLQPRRRKPDRQRGLFD